MNEYDLIISFLKLYKSLQNVKRGVTWKDSVALYTANGLKNTYKLRQDLLKGVYSILPYFTFKVTDPKEREVMATQIRDRQFQDSLCRNYFYDEITKGFIRDNYACQRGRGVDDAIDRLEILLHKYYRKYGNNGYVLKCDIHHYFAETEHKVANLAVKERINNKQVVEAVSQIIYSFGDGKNIGLGSPVSQLIQLAVLDNLDHLIKEKLHIKYYVRYMDDFILIHQDKEYLQYCLSVIKEELNKIHLTLNKKTQIFSLSQGIIFLQQRFYLTKTGKVIRLITQKNISHERRKLRRMQPKVQCGQLTIQNAVDSFLGWAAHAERKQAHSNRLRRQQGRRAWKGYNAKYIEKMRDYFFELYKIDPYSI